MQQLTQQKYIIAIAVVAIVAIGLWFVITNSNQESPAVAQQKTEQADTETTPQEDETPSTANENTDPTPSTQEGTNETDTEENPIIFTHAELSYDPSDTKVMVENKNNIFLGKVLRRAEDRVFGDITFPTFKVMVISGIKGSADEEINIGQGDIFYRNNMTYVAKGGIAWPKDVKEEDILLKEGGIYLFATNYSESLDRHGVSLAPYDRELITADSTLSDTEIVNLAKQNPRVQEFVQAARELGLLNEEWR